MTHKPKPRLDMSEDTKQLSETPANPQKLLIALVNAVVYHIAYWTKGIIAFQLTLYYEISKPNIESKTLESQNPDLNSVLSDYHLYTKVFSKQCSKQLPEHCSYDLSI